MAETIGELEIALTFDGNKFKASQKQVEQEAEKTGKKITDKMSSVGKKATIAIAGAIGTAVGTATAAIGKIASSAFNLYGEFEQLTGGVETLFKDSSDVVVNNAKRAFETAQISANDYMNTVTSFSASLLQSLGGDTKKAAEYADRAIIDMADNANKMGTSIESIQNAYQGFAKQNYTMLDNLKLGYGGTKTEMQRLIKDASQMIDVQNELGVAVEEGNMSFANMVNAISVVQKHLGIAGTSAQEASKTVQGSINSMKAAWKNLVTSFGDPNGDVEKNLEEFMKTVETMLDNAIPLLERIFDKIMDALPDLIEKLIDKLPDLIVKLVPAIVRALVRVAGKIIEKLPQIVGAIFQALFTTIGVLIEEIFPKLGEFFGAIGENLGNFFSGVWENIINGARSVWEGIQNIFGGIAEWFGNVFRTAWEAVKAVFETGGKIFTGLVEGIVATFKAVVNGIISGINFVVAIPFNAINGFLNILRGIDILGFKPFDWVGTIAVPQIPLLAKGGYADGASNAIIGENGKEVVLPLENNTDNWSGLLANALAEKFNDDEQGMKGGVTIENQNFNISSQLDAENIGHIMMQSIRRQAR